MADRGNECLNRPAFYLFVLVAAYLSYLVISPFLVPLIWAAVFATLFYGTQSTLSRRIGQTRAALVMTLLTAALIVAPAVMLVSLLAGEVPTVADYVQRASLTAPGRIEQVWQVARARLPIELPEDPTLLLRDGAQRLLTFLAPRAGAVVADVFATLGILVAMLFTLFFMLRDGDRMARDLRDVLPLPAKECDRLLSDTRDLVIASVGAGVAVAIAQGAIGGAAFWLVGIAAPAFWGTVIAFCSLLPVVGAALVWLPAALWLLLSGAVGKSVVMVVVGIFGISMADNVLRPLLLSGRTSVSGLVIFFGLLGGMAAFGFIGLVLGPIILIVTGRLFKIFAWPHLIDDSR